MPAYFVVPMDTEDERADFSDTDSFTSAKETTAELTHPGKAEITAKQDTKSPEAKPQTTSTDHAKADQSTAAMEPAVGKHHKRNQNRKNKRKAARHGRFEYLPEDAAGNSIEVETALPQAHDTNDNVAPVEAAQDVVAKPKKNSRLSRALNLDELNIKLEKLARARSTVTNTQSVPGSFEVSEDDDVFEDVRETKEDKNGVIEEDSVSSKDDHCTAGIDAETVKEAKGEGRHARRNKKRAQEKKNNKKAQNGIIAFMDSLGMTEGQKLGAGFLAGFVVGSCLTRMLDYLGGR